MFGIGCGGKNRFSKKRIVWDGKSCRRMGVRNVVNPESQSTNENISSDRRQDLSFCSSQSITVIKENYGDHFLDLDTQNNLPKQLIIDRNNDIEVTTNCYLRRFLPKTNEYFNWCFFVCIIFIVSVFSVIFCLIAKYFILNKT